MRYNESMIQELIQEGRLPEAADMTKDAGIGHLLQAALIYSKLGDRQCIKLAQILHLLEPDNPYHFGNLSYFYGGFQEWQEALNAITGAIELKEEANFYFQRAVLLCGLLRIEEAIADYLKVIELAPDNYLVRFNLGCAYCTLGDYKRGIPLLEYRFKNEGKLKAWRGRYTAPDWQGEDLTDKTLLVYSEQGHGDAIQHVRYIPRLHGTIVAEVQQDLSALLAPFFHQVFGRTQEYNCLEPTDLPHYDYVVSLNSLPYIVDPELTNIPDTPYIKAEKIEWKPSERFNVGLCWAGNPRHINDPARSMRAKTLIPLVHPDVQLYSFQTGDMKRVWFGREVDLNEGKEDLNLIELPLVDFAATASYLNKMDLIITVDTAVAHLAGAIGKPVLLMLPCVHDYRWRLKSESSHWYKSMGIFHQSKDWDGVVVKIKNAMLNMTWHQEKTPHTLTTS